MPMFKCKNDLLIHNTFGLPRAVEVLVDASLSANDIKLLAAVRHVWGYKSLAARAKDPDLRYVSVAVQAIAEQYYGHGNVAKESVQMVAYMLARLSQWHIMVSQEGDISKASNLLDADVRRTVNSKGASIYYLVADRPLPWLD